MEQHLESKIVTVFHAMHIHLQKNNAFDKRNHASNVRIRLLYTQV